MRSSEVQQCTVRACTLAVSSGSVTASAMDAEIPLTPSCLRVSQVVLGWLFMASEIQPVVRRAACQLLLMTP